MYWFSFIESVHICSIILKFQLWLVTTGKVPKPWNDTGTIQITDFLTGNALTLPTTGAVSMAFSLISILKACPYLNRTILTIQFICQIYRYILYIARNFHQSDLMVLFRARKNHAKGLVLVTQCR